MAPFFSIAVTTYKRPDFLKACLNSILSQGFQDYEVLIGNDACSENLSAGQLGIDDARFHFVNHRFNLGEAGNVNALLAQSRGRYFTWIMDDDLYSINFLEKAHRALMEFDFPKAVLSSFTQTPERLDAGGLNSSARHADVYSGKNIFHHWLTGKFSIQTAYGLYDTDFLKSLGGFEILCDASHALYSDFLLFVKLALVDRVAYLEEPLILNRVHEHSWSDSNRDLPIHHVAGHHLVQKSGKILLGSEFLKDREFLFSKMVRLTSIAIVEKSKQCFGFVPARETLRYAWNLRGDFIEVYRDRLIPKGLWSWFREMLWLSAAPAKEKLKRFLH